MTAIAHAFAEQPALQQSTGTAFADTTGGPSLASSNFVAGQKYLIVVMASVFGSGTNAQSHARVAHGGTGFTDSEIVFEPHSATGVVAYFWFDVWTAVSGEDITFQLGESTASVVTSADQIVMFAVRLDADLTEGTDWHSNVDATDLELTTSYQAGASVTFTPATAGDPWLLLNVAQVKAISAITTSIESRANLDGTGYAMQRWEPGDVLDKMLMGFGRVATLSAASHTFEEEALEESTSGHDRLHSKVFALNLAKFKDVSHAYADTKIDQTATAWAQSLGSFTHDHTVNGDVLILAFAVDDMQFSGLGSGGFHRLQVNDVDEPDTQTTAGGAPDVAPHRYAGPLNDATDRHAWTMMTVENLTADALIDSDSYGTAATLDTYERSLIAFSMELAGGGGGTAHIKVRDEPIGLTEAALRVLSLRRLRADAVGITEATARLLGLLKLRAEPMGMTEARVRVLGIRRLANEVLTIIETSGAGLEIILVYLEDLGVTETVVKLVTAGGAALVKVRDEAIAIAEATLRRLAIVRLRAEALGLTEVRVRLAAFVRLRAEAIGLAEAVLRRMTMVRLRAEALAIAEAVVRRMVMVRVRLEPVAMTELVARLTGLVRLRSETLGLTEQLARVAGVVRSRLETVGLTEARNHVLFGALVKIRSEAVALAEAALRILTGRRVVNEPVGVAETQLRYLVLLRVVAEQLALLEVRLSALVRIRVVSEALAITETIRSRLAQLGIAIVTVAMTLVPAVRASLQTLPAVAASLATKAATSIRMRLNALEVGPVLEASADLKLLRFRSETVALAEAFVHRLGLGRVLTETLGIAEGVVHKLESTLGLLLEPAATNYAYENHDFSLWSVQSNVSLAGGQPLRSSTYGHLVTASVAGGDLANPTALPSTTARHVVSLYWKKGTSQRTIVDIRDHTGANQIRLQIDPTAGDAPSLSIATAGGASGGIVGAFVLEDGVYRVYATAVFAAAFFYDIWIKPDSVGTGNVFLALPQLEPGSSPSSPIPNTGTSAVTRAADDLSRGGGAALGFTTATLSFGVKAMLLRREVVSAQERLFILYNSGSGFYIGLTLDPSSDDLFPIDTGSVGPAIEPRANLVGVRTAYVRRSDGTDRHNHALGALQTTQGGSFSGNNIGSDTIFGFATPQILYSMALYDGDIGAAEANAAHASGAAEWPATARVKLYDWTGQSMPGEYTHARASSALREDFTLASTNVARYAKAPF